MCRERNDPIALRVEIGVGCHQQRTDPLLEERREGSVQLQSLLAFDMKSRWPIVRAASSSSCN